MDFGVKLPNFSPLGGREPLVRMARAAEELGYSALWAADHIVIPERFEPRYPYSPTGAFPFSATMNAADALIALGVAAGCTERVTLGTSVLVLPYRNPLLTAKMLASLDMFAPGRVILGVGTGWMKEEFEALSAPPYEERGRVTDEWIRLFRACWTEAMPRFGGAHYSFGPLHFLPKPARPLPVWVGGNSAVALRRVGRLGDGWLGTRENVDNLAGAVAAIKQHAREAGRDPNAITMAIAYELDLQDREADQGSRDLVGSAEQIAARLREVETLGFQHVELRFRPMRSSGQPSVQATLAMMEAFANRVMPLLKRWDGSG